MYSKFIEIINHFLDDIQANEPYVLRRLIPMAIDNQDNYCIQPLLFSNKTRQTNYQIQKKLQHYLKELDKNNDDDDDYSEDEDDYYDIYENDDDEEKDSKSKESFIYKVIVKISRKCEEFYCHNNTIIGPVIKQWKQHYHQQQSSKLIDNDQQQKQLIQEFYRHIGVWLIVIDYHRQRFERISHILRWICSHIHIPYRISTESLFDDDDENNDENENNINDNYIHNDFALRVSISIVYHLIQYRLYLLDRFFICLKEIQKLSSKLIQPSSSVSSGQQLRMIINTTTTNALTAAATTSRE
uniref:Uncharacterized protein LOC113795754 n=1 Tax=Dermatophagoides pteronyssinus TaxID=6956 RepID=A0A6P6Y8Y7_DERPT|nr:uncharacterized protein LOC113795754 [Dermatophagoides pteronyssinus]